MKVLFFTSNIEGPGVGYDVKYAQSILKKKMEVFVFHFGKKNDPKNKIYNLNKYRLIWSFRKFKNIYKTNKIDVVHVRGLISSHHLVWFIYLILLNAKYIISPNSQLNEYNLKNKIFVENPDFKNLKNIKNKNKISKIFFLYYYRLIPYLKFLYLNILGKIFIKKSSGLICFSNFEKKNIVKYKKYTRIIVEPIFINNSRFKKIEKKNNFFYNKKDINIIYWGRLDYHLKGLDRLVHLAKRVVKIDKRNVIKFHLMGPNYNNGVEKTLHIINKFNLSDKIILHPENVWKGNISPLIKADYSILLSRWDGQPRSLRESIFYNVPIIASPETNFGDMIKENNCGHLYNKNLLANKKFFQELINNKKILKKNKAGCYNAKKIMSSSYYITQVNNFYRSILRL